jgi:transmembrane sensor
MAALSQQLAELPPITDAQVQQLLAAANGATAPTQNVIALHAYLPTVTAVVRPRRHWLALAASLLVAATLLLFMHDPWHWRGEQYQAADDQGVWRLRDGSILHLQAHSAVRVRFSSSERRVELQRGQAMFEVSHHTQLPFRVVGGFADVVAVGTRFEVSRTAQSNQVTVVEGKVLVQPLTAAPQPVATLVAGQRLLINARGELGQPQPADARQVFAWVQRQLAFEQQPLAVIVEQINQYALLPISINDATLAQLPISGVFNAYDAQSFIEFLQHLPGVVVTTTAQRVQVARVAARPAV